MGQGFSNSICPSEDPKAPKSIMIFSVESDSILPVTAAYFFRNLPSFYTKTVLLVEPPPAPSQRTAEYMYPKMSYKETVRSINEIYKISPTLMKNLKIWIFTPSTQRAEEKNNVMNLIQNMNFENFASTVDLAPSSIFTEQESTLPKSISDAIKKSKPSPKKTDILYLPTKQYTNLLSLDTNSLPLYSPTGSPKTAKPYRDSCDFIVDGLYISGEKSSSDLPLLLRLGITHIVNMNASSSPVYFPEEFTYYSVHLADSVFESLDDEFWSAVAFTNDAIKNGGKVLIHCRKGISRSAALCLAYLIQYRNMNYETAMKLLRKARPCIDINKGFAHQIESRTRAGTPTLRPPSSNEFQKPQQEKKEKNV